MSDWLLEAALTEAWMVHVGGYVRTGRMVRPYLRAPRGAAVPHLAVVGRPIDTHALQVGDVLIDDTHRQWRVHALQPAYAYDLNRSALVGVSPVGGGRVVNRRLSKFTRMAPGVPGWEAPRLDYTPKTLREWADIGELMAEQLLEYDPDQPRDLRGRWVLALPRGGGVFHTDKGKHKTVLKKDRKPREWGGRKYLSAGQPVVFDSEQEAQDWLDQQDKLTRASYAPVEIGGPLDVPPPHRAANRAKRKKAVEEADQWAQEFMAANDGKLTQADLRAAVGRGTIKRPVFELLSNAVGRYPEAFGLEPEEMLEFDPHQPRVPAGAPDGGRWVKAWHISDVRNRESIEQHGLQPSFYGGTAEPTLWLWPDREAADKFIDKNWGGSDGKNDLWEVTVSADDIVPDPHGAPGAVAIHRGVSKDRMRRVADLLEFDPHQARWPKGTPLGGRWRDLRIVGLPADTKMDAHVAAKVRTSRFDVVATPNAERQGFDLTVTPLAHGMVPVDVVDPKPSLTKRSREALERAGIKLPGGQRRTYIDPDLATVVDGVVVPKEKNGWSTEMPLQTRKHKRRADGHAQLVQGLPRGQMARGMSGAEFWDAMGRGQFQSRAEMNVADSQAATTSWSADAAQARTYATGFVPWHLAPTREEPGYVVVARRSGGHPISPYSTEIDSKPVSVDDIVDVIEIRPYEMQPESFSLEPLDPFRADGMGLYGGSGPMVNYVYRRVRLDEMRRGRQAAVDLLHGSAGHPKAAKAAEQRRRVHDRTRPGQPVLIVGQNPYAGRNAVVAPDAKVEYNGNGWPFIDVIVEMVTRDDKRVRVRVAHLEPRQPTPPRPARVDYAYQAQVSASEQRAVSRYLRTITPQGTVTINRDAEDRVTVEANGQVHIVEFDPDQPRMPAGREGGGRWVKKARLSGSLFHVSPEFNREGIRSDGLMPPERVPGAAGGLQGDHGDDRPDHIALVRDPDAVYFHAKRGVSENYAQWRERDGRERKMFSTYGAYPNTRQDLWQAAGVPLDSLAPDHETFADLVLFDFFAAKESGDVWDLDNEYRNISAGADTLGTFLRYRGMELLTARGMWPMTGSRYSRNDNEMYNRVRDEREAAIMLLHEMPPDLRTALALRWAEEGMGVMVYGGVPKSRVRRVERMYEAVWIAERMLEQR